MGNGLTLPKKPGIWLPPAPAIITSEKDRWKRDPGVAAIIRYFDQPERVERPDLLSRKDLGLIQAEATKCIESFEYAARNYFWIVNEKNEDVLFNLWEAQELILEKIYWMRDRGKAQKLIIIKGRRLGCSTLIEAMIAWHCMFFRNRSALIVSYDDDHASSLFGIMLHIFDQMPWWLKPMVGPRKYQDGLHFINPDPDARKYHPGMNSKINVESAHKTSGVGQGVRLTAAHLSEFCDWDPMKAKEIIEGDMVWALAPYPTTFAVLESTGKGSGTYSHKLWKAMVDLAERAKWYPLFLPAFFEKSRVIIPEKTWVPQEKEVAIRNRIKKEWLICDYPRCSDYRESTFRGEPLVGNTCPVCGKGKLIPVVLSDAQLCYMEDQRINAEKIGSDAVKLLHQELATTAEDSFQLSGFQVFPQECFDWVNTTIDKNPPVIGNLDEQGRVHWVKEWRHTAVDQRAGICGQEWCGADHQWDLESPLRIWEWPEVGAQYTCGVDVSEGIGENFSVAWINKVGGGMNPDVHVATYRSNTISAYDFAAVVNFLGRTYNDALMSIEYNYPTTADRVLRFFQYPNVFRWKHYDNVRPEGHQWHWMTQQNSKPLLWQTAIGRLKSHVWYVRDERFYEEMKTFQKEDYSDRKASAETGSTDDLIIAALICLFTSHDMDYDPNTRSIPIPSGMGTGMIQSPDFTVKCQACKKQWDSSDQPPTTITQWNKPRCQHCGSILLSWKRNIKETEVGKSLWDELGEEQKVDNAPLPEYSSL